MNGLGKYSPKQFFDVHTWGFSTFKKPQKILQAAILGDGGNSGKSFDELANLPWVSQVWQPQILAGISSEYSVQKRPGKCWLKGTKGTAQ